jgi:hypothetical protein
VHVAQVGPAHVADEQEVAREDGAFVPRIHE